MVFVVEIFDSFDFFHRNLVDRHHRQHLFELHVRNPIIENRVGVGQDIFPIHTKTISKQKADQSIY